MLLPIAPTLAIPVKDKFLPGLAVRLTRMKEVIKTTRPHGHRRYYELIYLTHGAGWHYIDFQRYPVVPHTYYLICPGQVHHWELSEVPRGYVLMVNWGMLPRPDPSPALPALSRCRFALPQDARNRAGFRGLRHGVGQLPRRKRTTLLQAMDWPLPGHGALRAAVPGVAQE